MKQCGRPGRNLLPPWTQPHPSALSLELPNVTISHRWMKMPPNVCVAGILRNWSSTPPVSCWGLTRLPPASTPPTPIPSCSGSMGYSSWRSTTRQMVMGLLPPEGSLPTSLLCVLCFSKCRATSKIVWRGPDSTRRTPYARGRLQRTEVNLIRNCALEELCPGCFD